MRELEKKENIKEDFIKINPQSYNATKIKEYILLFNAKKIEFIVEKDENIIGNSFILVKISDLEPTLAEIEKYHLKNNNRIKKNKIKLYKIDPSYFILGAILFLGLFLIQEYSMEIYKWKELGKIHVFNIRSGEWHRVVTALTLHKDLAHLLSNLIFGTIFIYLLSLLIGPGAAVFLTLFSGIYGNMINTGFQSYNFMSLGASTAVFGAIGILGGLQIRGVFLSEIYKPWVPPFSAFCFLVILGTGGTNVDIFGHFFGFGIGFLLGIILTYFYNVKFFSSLFFQKLLLLGSFLIIFVSWLFAFDKLVY